MAGTALFGVGDIGVVVFVQRQHARRAEFDAETATFTPHAKNDHLAARAASRACRWGLRHSGLRMITGRIHALPSSWFLLLWLETIFSGIQGLAVLPGLPVLNTQLILDSDKH